jgi:hypothetical protein
MYLPMGNGKYEVSRGIEEAEQMRTPLLIEQLPIAA